MRYGNRAYVETGTVGTGVTTLGAAVPGFRTLAAAGILNGDTVPYVIEDGTTAWEIGTGIYNSTGPTLTRVVTESTNSNAALNLSGAAKVFIDAPASFFNSSDDYGLISSAATATDDFGALT